MAIEMKTCLAMVISGDRQHSASRREDAGEQATKVSWVWGGGEGDTFVGVRGQLWKGCGSEVGFEEDWGRDSNGAEATSSGEHLHRYEGSQNCSHGSTQSTYRSARKSFVRRFASTHMSSAAKGLLRKHGLCWKVCRICMFANSTVCALSRRPWSERARRTVPLSIAARQSRTCVSPAATTVNLAKIKAKD